MSTEEQMRNRETMPATVDDGRLAVVVGNLKFLAKWESSDAPNTCALFRRMLPLRAKLIHCSWSGEGVWVPLEKRESGWQTENETCQPRPGQLLLYMGNRCEPEFLIPCGTCIFNCQTGVLAGNHFATIVDGLDRLTELHRLVLWQGAQDCVIETIPTV